MANQTNYTRKQFLTDMLAGELSPEQRECAEKWLAALEKKSNAPRVNKTRVANEQLADAIVAAMVAHADTPINAKFLSETVAGITSPAKAAAVVAIAIEDGRVAKYTDKGRVFYRLNG